MGLFSSVKDNLSNAISVIERYPGTEDYPIWCHPSEDFRNGSRLIVGSDDTALLYDNGNIVATFSGGNYELSTNNYPFIDKLRAAFSGGEKCYKYRVFFIDAKEITNLLWGTTDPIQAQIRLKNPRYVSYEETYGVAPNNEPKFFLRNAPIQARGNYSFRIVEPKLFLQEYGGTSAIKRTELDLDRKVFRGRIIGVITDLIKAESRTIDDGWNIQEKKTELSKNLREKLDELFQEKGIRLTDFRIEYLTFKEDDPEWQKTCTWYNSLTESQMAALNKRAEVEILGNDWQKFQSRDILRDMANNPGAGGMSSMGAGIGMGVVAGGMMGHMASEMMSPLQEQVQPQQQTASVKCPKCGADVNGGKFCSNCGSELPQKKFCTNCGKEITPGAKFCSNCGNKTE